MFIIIPYKVKWAFLTWDKEFKEKENEELRREIIPLLWSQYSTKSSFIHS
jgi:hypothetical protein